MDLDFSDTLLLTNLAAISAGLLGFLITLIIAYWVIRLAVYGALKRHTRWIDEGKP